MAIKYESIHIVRGIGMLQLKSTNYSNLSVF